MGYSIYAAAPTKELQQKMYDFLLRNMEDFPGVERGFSVTDDPSYVSEDVQYPVGFDYGPIMVDERAYAYALVYWVSEKLTEPPYTYYYDDEPFPSLTLEDCVNKHIGKDKLIMLFRGVDAVRVKDFVEAQWKRLDELWEKE